ncbi:hypothetical protein [Zhaonella formicivorans]|uniref:hypothetical protein n=1 Tax=Zhaonella formicivorans TaxID=2528593 RepID=UPI0010D7F031|nr:hypothetical protein [Zhaonella formicivorans]
MLPVIDDRHSEMDRYAHYVANIVFSERFLSLKKELERIYSRNGLERAKQRAFQEAFYSIIAEEDQELIVYGVG